MRKMKPLGSALKASLSEIGGKNPALRKAARAAQVNEIWKKLVEPVFLEHTNAVFIFTEDGRKKFVVYVDESIYAAELNARREIIKMKLHGLFGEEVDDFLIHVSRGKYKKSHPFVEKDARAPRPAVQRIPLSREERRDIEEKSSAIQDARLRKAFTRAMISDIESKSGIKSQKQ